MNLNTLKAFRQQMADCFDHSRDALLELVDALSSELQAHSFPEVAALAAVLTQVA